jgi:hypothetical protein
MKNHVASKELLRKNQIPVQEGPYQSHLSYQNLKVHEFSEYQLMKDNQSSEAFLVQLGPILAYGFAGPVHSYSPYFRMQDLSTSTLCNFKSSKTHKTFDTQTLSAIRTSDPSDLQVKEIHVSAFYGGQRFPFFPMEEVPLQSLLLWYQE